jgi:hypothetical protein
VFFLQYYYFYVLVVMVINFAFLLMCLKCEQAGRLWGYRGCGCYVHSTLPVQPRCGASRCPHCHHKVKSEEACIAGGHNFEEDLIKYYWKDGAARSEYHHLVGDTSGHCARYAMARRVSSAGGPEQWVLLPTFQCARVDGSSLNKKKKSPGPSQKARRHKARQHASHMLHEDVYS